jgi:hypothetical protein
VSRFLAINIEGKIGELTVRRTSSFIILSPDEWVMVVDYVEEFVIPALTYTLLVLKSPWRVASRTLHTTMLERFETLLIIMCVDREQRSIVFLQYP